MPSQKEICIRTAAIFGIAAVTIGSTPRLEASLGWLGALCMILSLVSLYFANAQERKQFQFHVSKTPETAKWYRVQRLWLRSSACLAVAAGVTGFVFAPRMLTDNTLQTVAPICTITFVLAMLGAMGSGSNLMFGYIRFLYWRERN